MKVRDFPPALRLAVVVWLILAAAITVRILLHPASHTVFPVFAAAGSNWWNDQSLYADYKPLDYFRYPPQAALFFSPLAALGLRAGGILWSWLSLAVYASGLWRFRRDVLPGRWTPRRESAFLAVATLGGLAGLWNAQSNALAVGMLLWGAAALARERHRTCAAWLAAAAWFKLTPLAPVLLLAALWPRRLVGPLAVGLAAGALVPFLSRPPETVLRHYAEWVEQQKDLSAERWPGFRDAWTVWQVARHAATGEAGGVPLREPLESVAYRLLQLAAAGGCLCWCLALRGRAGNRRELILRTLGVGSAWLMLFGPAIEYQTYVFLAPFLAAAVVDPDARPAVRALNVAASVLILGLGWGALSLRLAPAFPAILTVLPAGTFLYALGLALAGRQRGFSDEVIPPGMGCARQDPAGSHFRAIGDLHAAGRPSYSGTLAGGYACPPTDSPQFSFARTR